MDCSTIPEETKNHFRFVTDRLDEWHAALSHAIPLVPFPKEKLLILCVPTSQASKLFLQLGSMIETFIDVVSFMDIFFWFFTGDLDGETGLVVPKAFFGRCILPGTLVQVLDHPTLPKVLPSLLGQVASTAMAIGWSRVIRWVFAVVPAVTMVVFQPLSAYFFRHFEDSNVTGDEDILMSYAESFGYLPQRVSIVIPKNSGILRDDGSDDELGDIGDEGSIERRSSFAIQSLIDNRSPPMSPARFALRSTLSTNNTFGNHNGQNEKISPRLDRSPLKLDSSVRFANDVSILNDNNYYSNDQHSSSCFDIGYSLSSHALDDL